MQTEQAFAEGTSKNGTYWRRYGKSSCPLVMVVGYGGQMATWTDEFIECLAAQTDILIFDHLGSGGSMALVEGSKLSLADFASQLRGLLDELEISTVNLFGYSMGGCIALEFLRANPNRVNKLLLCSTTAGGQCFYNASKDVVERMQNPRGTTFEEMYYDFMAISMPAEAIEKYRKTLDKICAASGNPIVPKHVLDMKLRAFKQFDAADFLERITVPTLVIHGKDDELMPVENGLALSRSIHGSQMLLLDKCGHYPHIECQKEVVLNTLSFFLD